MTQKITYESLKAEQAWLVVSEQLQQRNSLLSMGINYLERLPGDLSVASRLMIIRYHLRVSLRKLTAEARAKPAANMTPDDVKQQWLHIHQLFFLLRQIDAELEKASGVSDNFRQWCETRPQRVYKSSLVHLN
ncbi:hypothetical protein [Arsenicibacter rosenii]|uniref:Uncharacterized protein n=1 Tax=Arsenicibacter rosenii TaxID=1750698 RepID=A0A1S2VJS0_9BACT|nr:hypothetical protein [Arsenicibacter rosenii]OIN59011.1 hypothetical protein BLX24_12415 [Arsenicibacter rosenii]